MRHRRNAIGGAATALLVLVLAGCGTDATPTTSTTTTGPQPTTSQPPDTTTATSAEKDPQPLPSSGILEPGECQTTQFEPTVLFSIGTKRALRPFDLAKTAGFDNHHPRLDWVEANIGPHKGVVIHNHWLGLDLDEVVAELEEIDRLILGSPTQIEVGGRRATQFEASVPANTILWSIMRSAVLAGEDYWDLEIGQVMRLIIVDTAEGSLLITVGAHEDDWDNFLPVAEEILAGISFPDL